MDLTGLYEEFFVFLLIFSRMSGLFIYAPIFSAMNIPNQAKVAFCGLFSYLPEIFLLNSSTALRVSGFFSISCEILSYACITVV